LGFQPSANVVVSITSADGTIATAAPASLTFTPLNYATPQNVTVTGVIDANAVTDATTLTFSAPSATSGSVAVTVPDKDTLGIVAAPSSLTIGEAGNGSVGFHLTAQPTGNVTVSLVSSKPAAATVSPATLTFTPSNWSVDQPVTVSGVSDPDTVDEHPTITASASGVTSATVAVTVLDDDTLTLVTDTSSVALAEGGTGTFKVMLSAQPQVSVSVLVSSPDTGAATVAPSTLTFTTSNWNVFQTVTVTGVQDQDVADESVALSVVSTGLPTVTVTANVT